MGYYIQVPENHGKANQIVGIYNGVHVTQPASLGDVPADKALICVVDNGLFEGAAFIYSEAELQAFSDPSDLRPKDWLLIDRKLAEELTGYSHAAG